MVNYLLDQAHLVPRDLKPRYLVNRRELLNQLLVKQPRQRLGILVQHKRVGTSNSKPERGLAYLVPSARIITNNSRSSSRRNKRVVLEPLVLPR
jgi:hypothetical protein